MMKFSSLLFSLLLAATSPALVIAAVNTPPHPNTCKAYKMCCDNEICTNNCAERPDCSMYQFPNIVPGNAKDLCEQAFQYTCCRDANGCGDPHFTTWKGEMYDFHGECDLVFLHAPSFGHGIGLDIHVRTTIRNDYSYIESAAIKIGDDVLEVASYGEYFLNGVDMAKLDGAELGSFPIKRIVVPHHEHNLIHFEIKVGDSQTIILKSFKDFVGVKMENAYATEYNGSTGLLGDFITGKRLARDGKTEVEDEVAFGFEWQVQPQEPKLFQDFRSPQLSEGQKCKMPEITTAELERRLAESSVSQEEAQEACAHFPEHFRKACVYDVLTTGDLDMATAGAF